MAFLKFLKGNYSALSTAEKLEGQILICGDTGEMFVDVADGNRVKIGDFTVVSTLAQLEALDATAVPTTRLYYVEDGNILARSNGSAWIQVNKQKTADELKAMLGLGSMAYVSEIVESNLSAELVEKINASAEGNHSHSNKDVLDGISAEKVAAWDAAEANAKAHAEGLVEAHEEAVNTALESKVDKVEGKSLIADAEIARLAAMSDGANKVEASETNGNIKIDGVETVVYTHPEAHAISEITGLQDALDLKLEAADIENKADKATTLAGYGITDAYTSAETDQKIADAVSTATGGESAASVKTDLEAYKTSNNAAVQAAADAAAAAQTAADEAQTDVDALAGVIGEVAEGKTVVEMIADAQTAATYDDAEVRGLISDNADAIDAIEADYLKAADKAELQEQINTNASAIELLTNGVDAEKVDGVNDLIKYVEEHGPEVTGMKADIKANADAIDAIEADYLKAADKTELQGNIDAAVERIADIEADYLKAADKTELEGEISAGDAASLASAKEYADGLNAAMNTRVEAVEAAKHTHDNKAVLDTITAEMLDCLVWGTFGA